MVQIARPTTDTTRDNWEEDDGTTVNIFDQIDEVSPDNTDYIRTGFSPTADVYVTKLGSLTDPVTATSHIVRYRIGKDTADGQQIDFVVQLRQAYTNEGAPGTLIAEWEHDNVDNTLATITQTLLAAEANAITDYTNLYFRFVATEVTPPSEFLRTVNVGTASQLSAALAAALPGDRIVLAAGNYNYTSSGGLQINQSGTALNPITITGPRTAIVNAYIWVRASYIRLRDFRIRGNSPQPMLWGVYQTVGGNNIYDNLEIDHQSQEGVNLHFGPSYDNEVSNCYIHDCGWVTPNRGEGVYIGDGDWDNIPTGAEVVDRTWIHHNVIENCAAEGVEIKGGTSEAIVEFNTITNAGHSLVVGSDAGIQVRGNNNIIRDNTITTTPRYSIENFADRAAWGLNNLYQRNTGEDAGNNLMFSFGTNAGSPLTGNIVCTDNVAVAPMTLNAGSRLQAC